jgi:transcriptional regulator with XRE-family HTH domain/DNA polymerase III delta prime subunit
MAPISKHPNTRLQQARENRQWTQSYLAQLLHVSVDTVRSWESGKRTPGQALQDQLCQLFGMTPELLGFSLVPLSLAEKGEAAFSSETFPSVSEEMSEHLSPQSIGRSSSSVQTTHVERFHFQKRGDENRRRMLQRVRNTWIDGVLQRSLHHEVLIELNLREVPDALENPWHLAVQETNGSERPLPSSTSLLEVYDSAEGKLLLLGEPGSGKTTLLLELARALLKRAEQSERYPMPVIFNLTSWPKRPSSLIEWLVEELRMKYQVPKQVGQVWVEENHLILLLDGLDETAEEVRAACMKAIGIYQREHPLVSCVICCRKEEYFAQTTRMLLQEAVLIQPLTSTQIDRYLASAGKQLESVRQALVNDPLLQEMSTNPLMLSIVTLAYAGEHRASPARTGSIASRRRHVFETYVQRMLERRGLDARYSTQETIDWLTWLAKQMRRQSLTEFYVERLQPDWLADHQIRERYRHTVIRLVNGIECFIVAGLFALLRGGEIRGVVGVGVGLLGWLGSGPGNAILGWMAPGLGGGLGGGGSLGIILAFVTILVTLLVSVQRPTLSWHSVSGGILRGGRIGLTIGIIVGVLSGLLFTLSGGVANGVVRGLGAGLFSGLLTGLESGLITGLRPALEDPPSTSRSKEGQRGPFSSSAFASLWSRRSADSVLDFLAFSWCAGVGFGGTYALLIGAITQNVLLYGAIVALFFGLLFSLGDGTSLIQGLGENIKPTETATWSWISARQALGTTLIKGVQVGLIVTLSVMVILGCASGLFYGVAYGFHYALVYGPIVGLVGASAGILTGILNNGWSSNMLAEHLLVHPNEGMRRTLKNALFATCFFGPLGGLLSGLVSGLAFWWIGGLTGWIILGIGFAIVFGAIFSLQFVTAYGGIAWIEHYLLRWYFWRMKGLPARCIPFLDYASERILLRKIGGGYMFSHRLLRDYFASLDASHMRETNTPDDISHREMLDSTCVQNLKAEKA